MYAINDLKSVLRGLEIYSTVTYIYKHGLFTDFLFYSISKALKLGFSFHKSKLQCTLILK